MFCLFLLGFGKGWNKIAKLGLDSVQSILNMALIIWSLFSPSLATGPVT